MIERINPGKRASQLVVIGGRIETSGIVAENLEGDIAEQTRCVLRQLEAWLAQVGATKPTCRVCRSGWPIWQSSIV